MIAGAESQTDADIDEADEKGEWLGNRTPPLSQNRT